MSQSVLLFQLDGKLPNIALMRIAAHHRAKGDAVELRATPRPQRHLWDSPDTVYGSAIFDRSRGAVEQLRREFPGAIIGGTGVDSPPLSVSSLESIGVTTKAQDYSIYPRFRQSIGFSQRGCRLRCSFCVVPWKEGANQEEQSINDIWRSDPWPREILLLDNDFFGQPNWRYRIKELRDGKFKVSFTQGINARLVGQEQAEAIASVNYRDDSMQRKRIYTAWDNRKDEDRLFIGLEHLVRAGVKPDEIMVYVLIGYDHRTKSALPTLNDDDFHRHRRLREFGCRPYPMPFVRTRELIGFQRWIVGAYDKRISWRKWKAAEHRPEKLIAGKAEVA